MPKVPVTNKNISKNSFININGERILLEITFINKLATLPIPIDNFISLQVEDEINSPFYKGILTIKNDNNKFDLLGTPEKINKINYNLLETGENLISITFNKANNFKKSYLFFIVDETSEIVDNSKVKNFYLEDAFLYNLKNSKEMFTTSNLLKGDTTQLSDSEREINVSDTIKNLIQTSISDIAIDNDNWYQSVNKLSYTSTINESRLESLDFILDKAIDQNNNFLYLLQRNNAFGLYSLKQMYEEYINNNYANNFGGNYLLVSAEGPTESIAKNNAFKVSDFSVYNENGDNTLDNIINYKVINYNFKDKKFNLFSKDNTVGQVVSEVKEGFLNKQTTVNRVPSPRIENNTFFKTLYTTNSDEKSARYEGRNIILKSLVNLSTMLTMRCDGVFSLNCGNFINVSHEQQFKNKINNKLNGGWFVVGYKHTFTTTSFTSEIACTKFHELI